MRADDWRFCICGHIGVAHKAAGSCTAAPCICESHQPTERLIPCGDESVHLWHKWRTPAYVGEWNDCPGVRA